MIMCALLPRRNFYKWLLRVVLIIILMLLGRNLFIQHQIPLDPDQDVTRPNGNEDTGLKKRLPSALIIGSKKCGTGALRKFLKTNSYVKGTNKEVRYFVVHFDKGLEWYRNRMPPSYANQITIEKSPDYITTESALQNIKIELPNSKHIWIVCEPVRRLISDYYHNKENNFYPEINSTLRQLIVADNGKGQSIREGYQPIGAGKYSYQLEIYLKYFPLNQLYIVDGDEFKRNPFPTIKGLEIFLGIPSYVQPFHFIKNKEKGFYCINTTAVNRQMECLPDFKGHKHPKLDSDMKEWLVLHFAWHNQRFFNMINRTMNWDTTDL